TLGDDAGEPSRAQSRRRSKLRARIAAYGTVDELNAAIGLLLATDCPEPIREVLGRVQNELFDLGADLSVPLEHEARLRVVQGQVDALEHDCDRFNPELTELKSFVLPEASPLPAAWAKIAISAAAAGAGGLRHAREGRVDWRVVAWTAPPSVGGAVAGALLADDVSESLLYGLIAAVLVLRGIELAARPA